MLRSEIFTKSDSIENSGETENAEPPTKKPSESDSEATGTKPPSYEHVLQETKLQLRKEDISPTDPNKGLEIVHKSSKELYKAVAKQYGITCKMSDHCRCWDCQSHYFDCEYDKNEDDDGGLGAGTPMFISEVIHGTACAIL